VKLIVDLEASSLDPDGHVVQVGWCSPDFKRGGRLLVAPHPSWPESAWSGFSERIHGISRMEASCEGLPAADVAVRLNRAFDGAELLGDGNASWDCAWLRSLHAAAAIPPSYVLPRAFGVESRLAAKITAAAAWIEGADVDFDAGAMAGEAGLRAHDALDDCLIHALRLAAVSIRSAEARSGLKSARALRSSVVEKASRLSKFPTSS